MVAVAESSLVWRITISRNTFTAVSTGWGPAQMWEEEETLPQKHEKPDFFLADFRRALSNLAGEEISEDTAKVERKFIVCSRPLEDHGACDGDALRAG